MNNFYKMITLNIPDITRKPTPCPVESGQCPPLIPGFIDIQQHFVLTIFINEQLLQDDDYQHTRHNSEANPVSSGKWTVPTPNIPGFTHIQQHFSLTIFINEQLLQDDNSQHTRHNSEANPVSSGKWTVPTPNTRFY